jgi:hypothetical protein
MLPEVGGAAKLGAPILQAGGRQARQSLCLPGTDLAVAGEKVRVAMTARGFSASTPQPRGKSDRPRIAVSGQKDDWRLNANILPATSPACTGKTEVLLTFHRVVKKEAGEAAPAAPAAPPTYVTPVHGENE